MSDKIESAIDIIYSLPDQIAQILSKIAALETRNAMLERKLDAFSRKTEEPSVAHSHVSAPVENSSAEEEPSEIMEIRPPAPQSQPFSFDRKPEKLPEGPALTLPTKAPEGIRIPAKDIDPMPQNAIPSEPVPEKQTSTLIRGRLKEREGSSIAAVDVKIFDEKSVMVKKTKTAATGEWIAMLPPGEYTAEFTKPGQKPLFKPISVVSGKKELEILI